MEIIQWLRETAEAYKRIDEDYTERTMDQFMRDYQEA